ncbi:unnamed protein product, partial [marine sediment metagenome]
LSLSCDSREIEITNITDQVRKSLRGAAPAREYLLAKGCQRRTYLECSVIGSGVYYDTERKDNHWSSDRPPEFRDPHWRCWRIPDPFAIPEESRPVPPVSEEP